MNFVTLSLGPGIKQVCGKSSQRCPGEKKQHVKGSVPRAGLRMKVGVARVKPGPEGLRQAREPAPARSGSLIRSKYCLLIKEAKGKK